MQKPRRHPTGFYILSFSEGCDRLVFWGIQAIIVLYLTQHFLLRQQEAYADFGIYTALGFATPILGGYLADRFLGLRYSIAMGIALMGLGSFVCLLSSLISFEIGLIWICLGIGLFKSNATLQLGLCYHDKPTLRSSGFTLFYMAMNAGSIIGPIAFGVIVAIEGWRLGFALCGVLMSVAWLWYWRQGHTCPQQENISSRHLSTRHKHGLVLLGTLLLTMAIILLFKHPSLFWDMLLTLTLLTLLAFGWALFRFTGDIRKRIIVFAVFLLLIMVINAVDMQTSSSMMLYLNRDVDPSLWGFSIPVEFFASLQPLAVIVLGFGFSACFKRFNSQRTSISAPFMVAHGVTCSGLAFVLLSVSAFIDSIYGTGSSLVLVIVANVLLGAGELCSAPIVMSAIQSLAPPHLKSVSMGIFFFAFALGGYVAGAMNALGVALFHVGVSSTTSCLYYRNFFALTAVILLIIAALAYLIAPTLKRFMR